MRFEHDVLLRASDHPGKHARAPPREHDPGAGSQGCDGEPFGDALPDEPPSPGSNSQTKRHFVLTRTRPREEEIRDVGASDDEDETGDRRNRRNV